MRPRAGTDGPKAWGPLAASLALAGFLLAALHGLPLLSVAANRLVPGAPVHAAALGGAAIPVASLLAACACLLLGLARTRAGAGIALLMTALAAGLLAVGLGAGASEVLAGRPPASRASLGAGAWIALPALAGAAGAAARLARVPGLGLLTAVAFAAGIALSGRAGAFDALSLVVEYHARRGAVAGALAEHLALSGGALALALVCAVALSFGRRAQGLVGLVTGGLQVVPAVALFGGLVALVSGLLRAFPGLRDLGLTALGPVPALAGIAAYLLLPLWRGIGTALRDPDATILDAAAGLGLTPRQVLAQVRLPLGAPILIGALRVAFVQSLGLATLAALIGAGGLGRIVFDGMAQFAPDLILLGAIPIVALSLAAEGALGRIEAAARRRWRP